MTIAQYPFNTKEFDMGNDYLDEHPPSTLMDRIIAALERLEPIFVRYFIRKSQRLATWLMLVGLAWCAFWAAVGYLLMRFGSDKQVFEGYFDFLLSIGFAAFIVLWRIIMIPLLPIAVKFLIREYKDQLE